MRTKKDALQIIQALETAYPLGKCGLDYQNAWQLLVAVRLSAQCTDLRVNQITPILFEKYPTLEKLSLATEQQIGKIIKSCGLFNSKARDISKTAKLLFSQYGGIVPNDMDTLLLLPGVGRKSANLVLGDIFGQPAVVADTHCIRISNRLGYAKTKDPYKIEMALKKVLPPEKSNDYCHRMVLHGREVCTARKAHCEKCCLADLCPKLIATK